MPEDRNYLVLECTGACIGEADGCDFLVPAIKYKFKWKKMD